MVAFTSRVDIRIGAATLLTIVMPSLAAAGQRPEAAGQRPEEDRNGAGGFAGQLAANLWSEFWPDLRRRLPLHRLRGVDRGDKLDRE